MKKGKRYKSEIIIDLRNNSQKDAVVEEIRSSTSYSVKGKDGIYTISVELSPRTGKTPRQAKKTVLVGGAPVKKKTSYVERIAESCGLLLEQRTEKSPQKAFP